VVSYLSELSTLHEHSIQSDSRRSLEIHLPTPALEDTEAPLSHSGSQSTQQDADEGIYQQYFSLWSIS